MSMCVWLQVHAVFRAREDLATFLGILRYVEVRHISQVDGLIGGGETV